MTHWVIVVSTAYALTGPMADGSLTRHGSVASNHYPLGTVLEVRPAPLGRRLWVVRDRIGWGTELDFWLPSYRRALGWGRRVVRVRRARPRQSASRKRLRRIAMTDCWLCTGYVTPGGYGYDGREYAHRRAYVEAHGPIPEGYVVDHLCRVRACVNPAHLRVIPKAENDRQRWADHGGVGDEQRCRHGHVGERRQTRRGSWYCRACNRERQRERRSRGA